MKLAFERSTLWRQLVLLGTVGISIAVLAILVYRERILLLSYDWQINWASFAGGFVPLLMGLALAAGAWTHLMVTLGSKVSIPNHVRSYCFTHLARRIPGTIWYILGRNYLYKEYGDSMRLVTLATGLELVLIVIAGALVTIPFASYSLLTLSHLHLIGLFSTLGVGLILAHPAVIHWILKRIGHPTMTTYTYTNILSWVSIYAMIWILGGLVLYLIANAITPVEWIHIPYVIASWSLVGTLSMVVFFLPSNLGFTEVGLSLLLATIIPSSLAVLIAICARICFILYELLAVFVIIQVVDRSSKP